MSQLEQRRSGYEYRVVEPGDRQGFLDLHETVWGHERGDAWFRWRFEQNPYVDEIPLVVAERDGQIVGVEPCLVFRLRVGTETVRAFQPADWAVHPDHRKRGVFTGMTERLLERYDDGPGSLYFNFPNDALVPGLKKFDWSIHEGPTTYYRIHDPERVVRQGSGSKREFRSIASRNLGRLVTPLTRGYLGVRDRIRTPVEGYTVERHESIPVDVFTDLAAGPDDAIHVARDAAYYRWRFANPRWETTAYVARRDGEPVAACITCTERRGNLQTAAVLDTVPRDGSVDPDAFSALLTPVVEDAGDADVVKVGEGPIPDSVLGAFGFRANDAFPMSALSNQAALAVRSTEQTAGDTIEIGGIDPDEQPWELALADQDIA